MRTAHLSGAVRASARSRVTLLNLMLPSRSL
jgi:hypothetical protein